MKVEEFYVRGDIVSTCVNCEAPFDEHEMVPDKKDRRCPGGTTKFQKKETKRRIFIMLDGRETEVDIKRSLKHLRSSKTFGWGGDVKSSACAQSGHGALMEAIGPNEADEHYEYLAEVVQQAPESDGPFQLCVYYENWKKEHDDDQIVWL